MTSDYAADSVTDVRIPAAIPALVIAVPVAVGVLLGFAGGPLFRGLANVLEDTPIGAPGWLHLLGDLPQGWSVTVMTGLGVAVGVVLMLFTFREALSLRVLDDHVESQVEGREAWTERATTTAVFRDRATLVFLRGDAAPVRLPGAQDLRERDLRSAFERHSWPWRDGDPHAGEYERWVDGSPGFATQEHTLLRRRLEVGKDDTARIEADDALFAAGLVARTDKKQLHVRRVS
ncbi:MULTISPECIES: YqeB family protein [Prauserella salsuginis group]|uniref:Uncharacterized protein n=1 Tax=Prauserella salsuginis TaxID=387889 RepID=A0ABW6G1Y1_9PSEU|nr:MULTISPECIES: hypothetical protein [Prauserella salsuginis group]MCR3720016.1 hypothetical protein [Prauserella flava]MCR3736440.1 hypothetical protein [Prauserella salsuginis]